MKIAELDRTFLARDVYSRWRRIITSAKDSIAIFAPYFDNSLINLLNSNAGFDENQIKVVTDLSADRVLEMPAQLRATKKLLKRGVTVLSLSGLHAKVLLIDDQIVSVGSQNFTYRGTQNKETTVVPNASVNESRFLLTLHQWVEESVPITEEEIDDLLSQLGPLFRRNKRLHKEIQERIDEIRAQEQERRQRQLLVNLRQMEDASSFKFSQGNGTIYATIKDSGRGYDSLMADAGYDLTDWVVENAGASQKQDLHRLDMYPTILADSNRLLFARIGKSRITYLRTSVRYGEKFRVIDDLWMQVNVKFPQATTDNGNIQFKLVHEYRGSFTFFAFFDGKSVVVKKKDYMKGNIHWAKKHKLFVSTIENEFFQVSGKRDEFFKQYLSSFRYSTGLDVAKKNVSDYLDGWGYRLSIIEFSGNPVLVIAKA